MNQITNDIRKDIRAINKRICQYYFKPNSKYLYTIITKLKTRFNISYIEKYSSIHLRIGDVDKQPYKLYINKTDLKSIINIIKTNNNTKLVLLSDSINVKKEIKSIIGRNILTDFDSPCHSRYKKCLDKSLEDMLMMKYSDSLILTRGSTFSLFGSYFSKCKNEKIVFVGHNYQHTLYFQ